jgi:hypothetical protein
MYRCFFINLPVGFAAIGTAFLFKKREAEKPTDVSGRGDLNYMDLLEAIFRLTVIVCLICGLQWGGIRHAWSDRRVVTMFVVSALSLVICICLQARQGDRGTIPPRILRGRSILCALLYSFSLSAGFTVLVYYLPIWFQAVRSTTAVQSGTRLVPLKSSSVVTTFLAGAMVSLWGYYNPFMLVSAAAMAIGSGLLTTLDSTTSQAQWLSYEILVGLGVGLGQQQPILVAQTVLESTDVPAGVTTMIFARFLGTSIMLAVGQSVYYNTLVKELSQKVPQLHHSKQLIAHIGATKLKSKVMLIDPALVEPVMSVNNHAVTRAFIITVATSAFAFVVAFGVEWKSMRVRSRIGHD